MSSQSRGLMSSVIEDGMKSLSSNLFFCLFFTVNLFLRISCDLQTKHEPTYNRLLCMSKSSRNDPLVHGFISVVKFIPGHHDGRKLKAGLNLIFVSMGLCFGGKRV